MIDIRQIPLFDGLSRVELARIVPELEAMHLQPGDVLVRQGEIGDALYIVGAGVLRAEIDRPDGPTVIDTLGAGQVIGEVALLCGEPRTATVRAMEPTTVWRLSRHQLDGLIRTHPSLALHFNRIVGQRLANVSSHLQQTMSQLADISQLAQATYDAGTWERMARAAPLLALTELTVALLDDRDGSTLLSDVRTLLEPVKPGVYVCKPGVRELAARWYRRHHGEGDYRQLAWMLATHCRERGDYGNAVEAFLEADAYDAASALLRDQRPMLVAAWGTAQVEHWARRAAPVGTARQVSEHVASSTGGSEARRLMRRRAGGALLAIAATWTTWLAAPATLGPEGAKLVALLAGATVLWLCDLAPEFFIALLVCVVAVMWNVAPVDVAFSGMTSGSFFLLFVILGCINLVVRSGFSFRAALLGLKLLPATYDGQVWALGVSGLMVTPLVPTNIGRLSLISPLLVAIKDTLRLPDHSQGSAGLALAAYMGYGQMSFLFMNGTAGCLLIASLLPPATASQTTWLSWLVAAAPLGLVYFAGSMLAVVWCFRPEVRVRSDRRALLTQIGTLGRIEHEERVAILALSLLLLLFVLQPLYTVDPAWLALVMVAILFILGADRTLFSGIDYPFLLYFAAFTSINSMFRSTGTDQAISAAVQPVVLLLPASPYVLLSLLCLVSLVLATLPGFPSQAVLMIATIPVAESLGYNPLVFGLIILATSLPGLVPSVSSVHAMFLSATEQRLVTHAQIKHLARLRVAVLLVAIWASIPFWQHLGMIP